LTASPTELVRMLYRIATDAIGDAQRQLAGEGAMARGRSVSKAFAAVEELNNALDIEKGGETAVRLRELYRYIQNKLLSAHLSQSEEMFQEASRLLTVLAESARESVPQPGSSANSIPKSRATEEIRPRSLAPGQSRVLAAFSAV
jgi:flagellar secretion chaperone FliS